MQVFKTIRLLEVAKINMGQSPPGETYNIEGIGLPFFQGKAEFGDLYPVTKKWCSKPRRTAEPGDILLSVRAPVGPINIAKEKCCIGRGLASIRGNEKIVIQHYLQYYFKKIEYSLSIQGQGSTFYAISRKDVEKLIIPIPPISEQKRIVEILDQADDLRKKRAEADAIAERIIPALFYKMFGDPLKLMNSDESASIESLDIEIQNGFACGQKDVKDGAHHLRMNNIDDLGILNLDLVRTVPIKYKKHKYMLSNGDILFMSTNSEDKIGKTCVFYEESNKEYLFSNHLTRLRIKDRCISPEYLSTYLHILWKKRYYPSIAKRWVNQATVSNDALKNLKIFIPDDVKNKEFIKIYKSIYEMQKDRIKSSNTINTLFSTLLYKAFTGNLTAKWREAHMQELLQEMEIQAQYLKKNPSQDLP